MNSIRTETTQPLCDLIPSQETAEQSSMDAAERQRLLVEWNATETDYPENKRLHEVFEAQADQTPDAVALIGDDRHFTYREVNARANQIAHHLRDRGVRRATVVALCRERSPAALIGLLAILKAG